MLARPRHSPSHARQQTLEAAIAWSYELLRPEEQATLRRLAVFYGGFSLTAATEVCADLGSELDTVERVTALVDRSVVSIERREHDVRYRLLESIALFAGQRLSDHGEADGARDRHAGFFLKFVQHPPEQLEGREQPGHAEQLDVEQDNLTAALAWCLDGGGEPDVGAELAAGLGWHWTLRGRSNLAKRWLDCALRFGDQVEESNLVALHVTYAVLAYSISDLTESWCQATEAVSIARTTASGDLLAEAIAQLALVDQALGKGAEAAAAATELRSLQLRLSRPRTRVMALLGTAQVALAQDQPEKARVDASRAREIAREAGDHLSAANSGFWLAYSLALSSAIPSARTVISEAVRDAIRSGYQLLVADNVMGEMVLAFAGDDLDTARQRVPKAFQMYRDQQRWEDLGNCLRIAAAIELKRGFPERSAVLLGASLRWTDRLDFHDNLLLPELAGLGDTLNARLGAKAFADTTDRGAGMNQDDLLRASWPASSSPT